MIEENIRTFTDHWYGTGAIENVGDTERLALDEGEYMISEVVFTDAYTVTLLQNTYDGTGDDVNIWYRHGATEAACLSADWNPYTVPFTSLGYVQVKMENSGPLAVSGTNGRYFVDTAGNPVFLTGSHTWGNRQDQSTGALDWDGYLDSLQAWGHNFIRLWVWECSRGFDNDSILVHPTAMISPEIYTRSGTAGANDGGNKWDLDQFNSAFFDRIRQRCIDAANRGMYVAIMLFNFASHLNDPAAVDAFTYHPYNLTNNINSVDADADNDNNGEEIETLSVSAVTSYQEAYVQQVIDTVNDLDNVIYEICNEGIGNWSEAWQNSMISFIQTYEAGKPKQHPVWFTVPYPDGDNADLLASDAEAISPNDALTTFTGAKVVIPDTDHYFGIGGSADWAWQMFTTGAGGVCYMDSYDNDWMDFSGSGHPIQNLRDNLGYILAWANAADLIGMTPQGGGTDPCSTGFCLYKTGEYICYQDDTGNFTLDLTGDIGTFDLTWRRLSDGSTSTDTVAGNGNRTLTPPWAGNVAAWLKVQ